MRLLSIFWKGFKTGFSQAAVVIPLAVLLFVAFVSVASGRSPLFVLEELRSRVLAATDNYLR